MSAIASLYGSPRSSSMISRDPDGMDPNGVVEDYVSNGGLEPSGSRADEPSLLSPSSASLNYGMGIAANSNNNSNPQLDPLDVVRLIGAPPPPPKTPPPKKSHHRRHTPKNGGNGSSSHSHHFKVGESPKTPKVSSFSTSFDDNDSLLYSIAESTPPRTGPPPDSPENRSSEHGSGEEKTLHTRNTGSEHSHSTTGSLKIDSPPPSSSNNRMPPPVENHQEEQQQQQPLPFSLFKSSNNNNNNHIVEERLKAAMAVYESEDLVLDVVKGVRREVLRPAMKGLENQQQQRELHSGEESPRHTAKASSPKVEKKARRPNSPAGGGGGQGRRVSSSPSPSPKHHIPPSPSSTSTRPHSNKTVESRHPSPRATTTVSSGSPRRPPSPRQAPSPRHSSSSGTGKGQQLQRPRRTASIERQRVKEAKQKRDQKRGFFKKLFRGRTTTRGEESSSSTSSKAAGLVLPPIPVSAPSPTRARSSPRATSSPRASSSPRSRPSSTSSIRSKSPATSGRSRSRSRSSQRSRSRSATGTPRSKSSPRSRSSPRHAMEAGSERRRSPAVHSPSHTQPRHLKPALKSVEQRHYQGPALASPLSQQERRQQSEEDESPETHVVEDPDSPLVESNSSSDLWQSHDDDDDESNTPSYEEEQPPLSSYSQDPPDDEHGDPPVFSGRPLVSPTSYNALRDRDTTVVTDEDERSRVEAVKSRLAEMYEGQGTGTGTSDNDAPEDEIVVPNKNNSPLQGRDDYFFALDDELSALTGTFGSKSFERSGSDSPKDADAQGKALVSPKREEVATAAAESSSQEEEHVDPFSSAFFPQEDASLPTPTHHNHGSNLRVQVEGPSQDPIGASPMKWDARGLPAMMNSGFKDPVGESPMHACKTNNDVDVDVDVDDPPLTAGFVDDDDSFGEEEKKEEYLEDMVEPKLSLSSSNSTVSETPFEKDFLSEAKETSSTATTSSIKATRAALKLAKVTGLDAIKEKADSVPTPKKNNEQVVGKSVVGVAPAKSSKKELPKIITAPVLPEKTKASNNKDLTQLQTTDVEKAGFKSASNTPVSGNKPALSITAAAFTNAKAVAYLHRLHGEPSPRHTWHASKRKTSDLSPLAIKATARKSKGKKNPPPATAPGSSKKPSPDEYGAHNFDESLVADNAKATPKATIHLEELHVVKTKEGALFGAYSSKFQGRKPTKKTMVPKVETPKGSRLSLGSRGRLSFSGEDQKNLEKATPGYCEIKPGKITGWAVAKGISLRRSKRDEDILSGKSERVVVTPRPKTEGRNRFNFFPQDESDIKDPIQRAGRRILSKSAIPIQSAARRYIARRHAIDRMWALIQIQSYYRRWRAEANLQASIHSSIHMQRAFRGWLARNQLKDMHSSATQIQKIVRGYLCQAKVYDTMYYIVRIQALFKGCYERKIQQQKKQAAIEIQKYLRGFEARLSVYRNSQARPIQALYRGHKARQEFEIAIASVKLLQSTWRAYSARITYQIEIVDIIIAQSVFRRWAACRYARKLKNRELFGPSSMIQAVWRGRNARNDFRKTIAARKIQTAWRGFQCYTDYIFSLVDILVVQRTARVWLAKRTAKTIRKENAAVKIQACWRRHKAQSTLLYSLVHIIIAQSVARRFLSRFSVQGKRAQIQAVQDAEKKRQDAAIAIQRIWRGFWAFSHYIIVQYEIARLQAIVRGNLARQAYNLKLGCAIIIQATIRRHLARNAIQKKMVSDAMTESNALALRERNAAKRIQFWWRIVLDWTREKKAALTIERFFIHVRREVDREIVRRERRKLMKKEKRRQQRRESDEKVLERAWLNTVDENTAVGGQSRESQNETASTRSQSAPRLREGGQQQKGRELPYRTPALGVKTQSMSPKPISVGQEVDVHGWPIQRMDSIGSRSKAPPTESVPMSTSEDNSEVSNITNPTFFNRMGPPGRYENQNHGRPQQSSRDKRMSTNDYIKKYGSGGGMQTAPNRLTDNGQPQHFFSDSGSVGSSKKERPVVAGLPIAILPNSQPLNSMPRNMPGTPSSRRRSSSTPRSQSSQGFGPNGTPRSFSTPTTPGTRSKSSITTPRNNYGASGGGVPSTPRSSSSHQVPSPRIQVGFPPVTPRSHKGGSKQQITTRGTAETESQTTYSQNSFSKASPRSRPDGHLVKHGNPVVVMKTYPDFSHSHSMEESQEVMYLEGTEVGEEYGEV